MKTLEIDELCKDLKCSLTINLSNIVDYIDFEEGQKSPHVGFATPSVGFVTTPPITTPSVGFTIPSDGFTIPSDGFAITPIKRKRKSEVLLLNKKSTKIEAKSPKTADKTIKSAPIFIY